MMQFARRPHWLKRMVSARSTHSSAGNILLTFDDGPHPAHTPAVLERLRESHLRAAFFLLGNRIDAAPQLVERIIADGHLVGNHTDTHRRLGWFEFRSAQEEIARCQERVPQAKLFRPPFGKLTPGLLLAARRQGLKCMNWTLDSGDWRCRGASDAKACARQVLDLIRPGDVVLFHDNHEWIDAILDVVLPALVSSRLLPVIERKSFFERSQTRPTSPLVEAALTSTFCGCSVSVIPSLTINR